MSSNLPAVDANPGNEVVPQVGVTQEVVGRILPRASTNVSVTNERNTNEEKSNANDNDNDNDNDRTQVKCCRRGCKSNEIPIPCCAVNCDRYIHMECFHHVYIVGKKLRNLAPLQVVCTKRHYDKVINDLTGKKLLWTTDGANGPDDPANSERILLDWILEPGNYAKYRGKGNKGTTKVQFCQRIATKINSGGVKVQRDQKQVINKIKHMEDTFRRAYDFSNTETGAGLMEEGTFEEEVHKICPYYSDLLDIMSDRASAKPKASSYDLDSSSFSSKDSNEGSAVGEDGKSAGDDNGNSGDDDENKSRGDYGHSDEEDSLANVARKAGESYETPQPRGSKRRKLNISLSTLEKTKKKQVSKNTISLLDDKTAKSIADLSKRKLVTVDLKNQASAMEFKMQKLSNLSEVRKKYPNMTSKQIGEMFPEFSDILHLDI
jgi:hypothetical protein